MPLELEIKHIGRVVVVRCRGRIITGEESQALQKEITHQTLGTKRVVLNLGGIDFVDSGSLGVLVRMHRSLRADRGDLKLCELRPGIFKVFQITHLHTIFEMYESEAQAVEAFGQLPSATAEAAHAGRKKVLCVDESTDVLAYLSVLLRRSGYEVMTTHSVADFARFLMATKPDAVVAAHTMQENPRASEALRRAGPQVRVLYLPSGFSSADPTHAGQELVERLQAAFSESTGV
jgi:anti-sigma B factor antagonist